MASYITRWFQAPWWVPHLSISCPTQINFHIFQPAFRVPLLHIPPFKRLTVSTIEDLGLRAPKLMIWQIVRVIICNTTPWHPSQTPSTSLTHSSINLFSRERNAMRNTSLFSAQLLAMPLAAWTPKALLILTSTSLCKIKSNAKTLMKKVQTQFKFQINLNLRSSFRHMKNELAFSSIPKTNAGYEHSAMEASKHIWPLTIIHTAK